MGVSENRGIPKSSILIGFSIMNHPFWGTLIFGNTHVKKSFCIGIVERFHVRGKGSRRPFQAINLQVPDLHHVAPLPSL